MSHGRKKLHSSCFFYMEIEIEIWMLRDERHVSAFRQVDWLPSQSVLLAAPLRR